MSKTSRIAKTTEAFTAKSDLESITSKFGHIIAPDHVSGHDSTIIDTSLPPTKWETSFVPVSTTEPVTVADDTPSQGPVSAHLDDGGFTISIGEDGVPYCGDPVESPTEPIEGGIICYIPPSAYDDRMGNYFSDLGPATATPVASAPIGVQHVIDGGFTIYMDTEGNTVCGTPPNPVQSAIDHFVTGTEKAPVVATEHAPAQDTPSFAEISGHFEPQSHADIA